MKIINYFTAALTTIATLLGCTPTANTNANTDAPTNTPSNEPVVQPIENNPDALINKPLLLNSIKINGEVLMDGNPIYITLKEENELGMKLSKNSCMGSYEINKTHLKFNEVGCTEMCCDSQFDQKWLELINKYRFAYKITDDGTLLLSEKEANVEVGILISPKR